MIKQVAQNSIIQITGKIISTILGLLIVSLMTRGLGADGFGKYTSVVAFLQFFGILVDFGLTMTLARELGRGEFTNEEIISNSFSFRTITSGLAFLIAPLVALFLPYTPEIKIAISLAAVAFWATSVQQSFTGLFQYKLATWGLTIMEILGRFVLLGGTWWLVTNNSGLYPYLHWLTASNIFTLLGTLLVARQLINFKWVIDKKIWFHLWKVTWPITVTIILNLFYFKTDTIILSWYKPNEDVGIYGAAYKVLEVLLAIPAIVGGLVLPLTAKAWAEKNYAEIKKLYSITFDVMLAAGLVVILGSFLVGTPIITWLAGPEFIDSGKIIGILSLATALIFIGNATGYLIFAMDQQRKMIPYYGVAAFIGIVGYLMFIPCYSYWGAAWMTVLVEFFMALVGFVILWRQNIKPSTERLPKILTITVLSTLILLLAWPWYIKLLLAAAVYLILIKLFKLWPQDIPKSIDL